MNGEIHNKIQRIEDNLENLKELKKYSEEEFTSDFRNIEATKHLLQTAVEAMIDIANHIIAVRKFKKPGTSAEAFEILAENDIISQENKDKYILMTKFRNRVVYLYTKVDDKEIYKIIQNNLDDYREFVSEILKEF